MYSDGGQEGEELLQVKTIPWTFVVEWVNLFCELSLVFRISPRSSTALTACSDWVVGKLQAFNRYVTGYGLCEKQQ